MSKENMKASIEKMLDRIDAKIEHIEDITADNREIIVKLVKQNNQIVKFLNSLDIHDVDDYESMLITEKFNEDEGSNIKSVKELIDEYLGNSGMTEEKLNEIKEFEEELQKIKSKITPGQIGEA